jgi:DNA-binding MarR family transcriptional regulator
MNPGVSTSQIGTKAQNDLDHIASQMFKLQFSFWALRHKNRVDDPHDLTEPEFVALDTLIKEGTCTVGQLQKVLDVQPAQMSRIIRSLESKGAAPLVQCQLNPKDKRRIDVTITRLGQRAHQEYRSRRLQANKDLMKDLRDDEKAEVAKLLRRFDEIMSARLSGSHPPDRT